MGGTRLRGEVSVVGAKNSALKLMAGALLAVGRTRLTNVPAILDVPILAQLRRRLEGVVRYDAAPGGAPVIPLTLLLVIFLVALLGSALDLLGFRLGGQHWQQQLLEVRQQGAQASRQLHNLTREAFVAMAEEIEKKRRL